MMADRMYTAMQPRLLRCIRTDDVHITEPDWTDGAGFPSTHHGDAHVVGTIVDRIHGGFILASYPNADVSTGI